MDSNFFIKLAREFIPDNLMDEGGALIAFAIEKAYRAGQKSAKFEVTDPKLVVSEVLHEISGLKSCSANIDISSAYHTLVKFGGNDITCRVTKCQWNIPENEHFFSIHVVSSTEDPEFDLYTCECAKDALLATISEIQETALAVLSFDDSIDLIVPPGETISDILDSRGICPQTFALNCGIPAELLDGIISGEEAITPEVAVKLEKSLNVPKSFWLNLQESHNRERKSVISKLRR